MRPIFMLGMALALPLIASRPAAAATNPTTLTTFQITGATTYPVTYGTDGSVTLGDKTKIKAFNQMLTGTTATFMSDHTGTLQTGSGTTMTPALPTLIVLPADTTNTAWVVDTLAGGANKFLAANTFLSFHAFFVKDPSDPTKGNGDGHLVLLNQDGSIDSVDLEFDLAFH